MEEKFEKVRLGAVNIDNFIYTADEIDKMFKLLKTMIEEVSTKEPEDPKDPEPEDPENPDEPDDPKEPEDPENPEDPDEPKEPEDEDPETPEDPVKLVLVMNRISDDFMNSEEKGGVVTFKNVDTEEEFKVDRGESTEIPAGTYNINGAWMDQLLSHNVYLNGKIVQKYNSQSVYFMIDDDKNIVLSEDESPYSITTVDGSYETNPDDEEPETPPEEIPYAYVRNEISKMFKFAVDSGTPGGPNIYNDVDAVLILTNKETNESVTLKQGEAFKPVKPGVYKIDQGWDRGIPNNDEICLNGTVVGSLSEESKRLGRGFITFVSEIFLEPGSMNTFADSKSLNGYY